MRPSVALTLAVLTFAASQARAESPSCREEVQKLCPGLTPGDGKLHDCVKAHESQLTPSCQAKVAERREQVKVFLAACEEDLKSKCSDIVPGEGRKLACLKAHEPTLTKGCAAAVGQVKHKRHAMRACRDDAQSLCPNIPRGEGRVKACLQAHKAQLSPACGAALSG